MTGPSLGRPGEADRISRIAAEWVLRQEREPLSAWEQWRFERWLAADPVHARAYEGALWALSAPARHANSPLLMAERRAALGLRASRRHAALRWGGGALALAASLAALWLWTPALHDLSVFGAPAQWGASPSPGPDRTHAVYTTSVGERAAIALPDGSIATLDTDSRLRLAYGKDARAVYLLRGQALFAVAKASRPFHVYAGNQRITALGTKFNVRLDGSKVKVALVEGIVQVRALPPSQEDLPPAPAPAKEVLMAAGEMLEAAPASPLVVRPTETTAATSWTTGFLQFRDVPLADAVAEINRYTTRPIAIADPTIGSYRVSGVFRSSDPERFARAMADIFALEAIQSPNSGPILRPLNKFAK